MEEQLDRHARALGRGKSVIVREWIMERLQREGLDAQSRRQAGIIAGFARAEAVSPSDGDADAWLHALDAEDGGYDWGEEGPPV